MEKKKEDKSKVIPGHGRVSPDNIIYKIEPGKGKVWYKMDSNGQLIKL